MVLTLETQKPETQARKIEIQTRKLGGINLGDFVSLKDRTNGVAKKMAGGLDDCTVVPIVFRFAKHPEPERLADAPAQKAALGPVTLAPVPKAAPELVTRAQQLAVGEIGPTKRLVRSLTEERESNEEKEDNNFGRSVYSNDKITHGILGC